MATDVSVIVDGNSVAFLFNSGWAIKELGEMYRGTSWYPRSDSNGSGFVFHFEGTSVAFVGIDGIHSNESTRTVQIDNGTEFRMSDNTSPGYKPWFQSTDLSDGNHTITVRNLTVTTEIDYAIVNVGNQTSLSGKNIIVDSDSPSILYSGSWSRNTSQFRSGYLGLGYPYGSTTHRSSTPGDTFTFRFTGTSISVYGLISWNYLGSLSATFAVDGATMPKIYNQTELTMDWEEAPNFLYYSLNDLPAGDHTLIVTITAAVNKTFMLNYITYTPSFATLLSIPSLSNKSSTIGSTVLGGSSSTVTSSASIESLGNPASQPLPTASIVGGVIGSLAFIVLIAVIGLLLLRQRKAKQAENVVSRYVYAPTDENYQDVANNLSFQHYLRRQGHQQPSATFQLSNSRAQYHPAAVKHGRSNPALQATDSRLPPPPNIDNHMAEGASEPPPYETVEILSSAHPVMKRVAAH